jgi:hypothetical protein
VIVTIFAGLHNHSIRCLSSSSKVWNFYLQTEILHMLEYERFMRYYKWAYKCVVITILHQKRLNLISKYFFAEEYNLARGNVVKILDRTPISN